MKIPYNRPSLISGAVKANKGFSGDEQRSSRNLNPGIRTCLAQGTYITQVQGNVHVQICTGI